MQNIPEIVKILGKLSAILSIAVSSHIPASELPLQQISDTLQVIERNLNKPLGGIADASLQTIDQELENKNQTEKELIKSKKYEKINLQGQQIYDSKYNLTYEITSPITAINVNGQNGIEYYARAWKNGKQLGFGNNGSVEIERFRVFNPPVLVEDPLGDIIRNWTDADKNPRNRHLREDETEALKQNLSHTISLVGKEGTDVVSGKVGKTTTTFYSDPGDPAANAVDCISSTNNGNGGAVWATEHDATTGNYHPCTNVDVIGMAKLQGGTYYIYRSFILFNTSSIGSGQTVSAATWSAWNAGGSATVDQNVNVVSATPASDTTIVDADYNKANFGTTSFGSNLLSAYAGTNAYVDMTINATGQAAINTTGVTHFGLRMQKDIDNSAPADGAGSLDIYSADQTGTANDDKLTVTYAAAAATAKKNVQMILYEE